MGQILFRIKIKTDNTKCLAYINHKGGRRCINCNLLAKKIWDWALERNNFLSTKFLPGAVNTYSYLESQVQDQNIVTFSKKFSKLSAFLLPLTFLPSD